MWRRGGVIGVETRNAAKHHRKVPTAMNYLAQSVLRWRNEQETNEWGIYVGIYVPYPITFLLIILSHSFFHISIMNAGRCVTINFL